MVLRTRGRRQPARRSAATAQLGPVRQVATTISGIAISASVPAPWNPIMSVICGGSWALARMAVSPVATATTSPMRG